MGLYRYCKHESSDSLKRKNPMAKGQKNAIVHSLLPFQLPGKWFGCQNAVKRRHIDKTSRVKFAVEHLEHWRNCLPAHNICLQRNDLHCPKLHYVSFQMWALGVVFILFRVNWILSVKMKPRINSKLFCNHWQYWIRCSGSFGSFWWTFNGW